MSRIVELVNGSGMPCLIDLDRVMTAWLEVDGKVGVMLAGGPMRLLLDASAWESLKRLSVAPPASHE